MRKSESTTNKNLKENKKVIAVGYGCLFRPQTAILQPCAQKVIDDYYY
ncbi:hypothetical protein ABIE66_004735 [Peribacillus sp. B2I2]